MERLEDYETPETSTGESGITPNVLGTKSLGSITWKERSTLRKPVENGNSQWLPPQACREDL